MQYHHHNGPDPCHPVGESGKPHLRVDIYRAAVPFLICDVLAILVVLFFPVIVSWPIAMMF